MGSLSLSIVALYFLKYIKFFLQIFLKGINGIVISGAREGWKRHPLFFFFKKIKIQRTARPGVFTKGHAQNKKRVCHFWMHFLKFPKKVYL
jgi:hypothetical protein